jgi:opacity protein-like surface antigen
LCFGQGRCTDDLQTILSGDTLCRYLRPIEIYAGQEGLAIRIDPVRPEESTLKAMLMIISLTLALASAAIAGVIGAAPGDSVQGQSGAFIGDSSYNSSSIRFEDQKNITGAPVSVSVGSGYYATHPITYNSGIGSQTQMVDTGSATSLRHEVDLAHGVSGATEFVVSSSSYDQCAPEYSGSGSIASAQMKIDENVTEGSVHIGVLQGSDAPGQNGRADGSNFLLSAWKDPSLEMDEDYLGTFHIHKNMFIDISSNLENRTDSWLNCCQGGYFSMDQQDRLFLNADKVFNYKSF